MKLKLNQNNYKILESITEYRVVTVSQISALFQSNKTATSKRMKTFKKEGLVETLRRQLGRKRGRPEELLCLAEKVFDTLKEETFSIHLCRMMRLPRMLFIVRTINY